jgi:NAD(P) transhydrogenase
VLSQRLAASHTTVYCGTASFEDAHIVRVRLIAEGNPQDLLLRGEHILIAIGSVPVRPETFAFDRPKIYDSDTILDLDRLPDREPAVMSLRTCGAKYACTFAALSTGVHVVDGHDARFPLIEIHAC